MKMKIRTFEKCCCFDLRTGSIILGYAIMISFIMAGVRETYEYSSGHVEKLSNDLLNDYTKEDERIQKIRPQLARITTVISGIGVMIIYLSLIAVCVVFLVGIYKEKPHLVFLFMITLLCFIVFYTLAAIVSLSRNLVSRVWLVVEIPYLLFLIYALLVVRSYYLKEKERVIEKKNPDHAMVPV